MVYGSGEAAARGLREFRGGRLLIQNRANPRDTLLPVKADECSDVLRQRFCFLAGLNLLLKCETFICSNFDKLKATDESTNSRNWPPCTPFGSANTTELLRRWNSSTRSGTMNASTKKLAGLWLLKSNTSLTKNFSQFC